MLYHQTDFKFSKRSTKWLTDRYHSTFENKFFHDLDIDPLQTQDEWTKSPVNKELKDYLKKYNLNTDYYGIGAFISNWDYDYIGNPHIDLKFGVNETFEIKTRFNVIVLGNPEDEMVWWTDWTYADKRLVRHQFKTHNGIEYTSWGIPGNGPEERWKTLGEPDFRLPNVYFPSAFVKTNCAHTVHVSPGPRLIVTVALDKTLEEIFDK